MGGIPEIAHLGVNRLVSPESVEELAAAILDSLAAPAALGTPPRGPEEAVAETADFLAEVEGHFRESNLLVAKCNH